MFLKQSILDIYIYLYILNFEYTSIKSGFQTMLRFTKKTKILNYV